MTQNSLKSTVKKIERVQEITYILRKGDVNNGDHANELYKELARLENEIENDFYGEYDCGYFSPTVEGFNIENN